MNNYEAVGKKIQQAKRIVILTGAGISTSSGIPDFRSNPENKELVPPLETILSRSFFHYDPINFWEFCEEIFNFNELKNKEPNEAHLFLAKLETELNKKVTIITQNIDGLHEKAGSSEVLDIHGNLNEVNCPACGSVYPFNEKILAEEYLCSKIKNGKECGKVLSPSFVLYGDSIKHKSKSNKRIHMADLMIVIGTSLKVSPANSFVQDFYNKRKNLVLINREGTPMEKLFTYFLEGDIVETIKKLKEYI